MTDQLALYTLPCASGAALNAGGTRAMAASS